MNKIVIAFLAALSLTAFGCKKKGGGEEFLKKQQEYKDKVCKCTTVDCVKKETEAWAATATEMGKAMGKDFKPDPDMAKKMDEITKAVQACQEDIAKKAGGAEGSAAGGEGGSAAGGE